MWQGKLFEENIIWEKWGLAPREGGGEDGGSMWGGLLWEGLGPQPLLFHVDQKRSHWGKEVRGVAKLKRGIPGAPNPQSAHKRVGMCFQKLLLPCSLLSELNAGPSGWWTCTLSLNYELFPQCLLNSDDVLQCKRQVLTTLSPQQLSILLESPLWSLVPHLSLLWASNVILGPLGAQVPHI